MVGITNANYKNSKILISYWGTTSQTSERVLKTLSVPAWDPEYFQYNSTDGKMTCIKACTGKLFCFGLGCYTSSGVAVTLTWGVYKSDLLFTGNQGVGPSSNSANGTAISLNVNDTLEIRGECSSAMTCSGGFVLTT